MTCDPRQKAARSEAGEPKRGLRARQQGGEPVKLVPLSKGQFAKVDDHRYDFLMRWKWHAVWNKKTGSYYAARNLNLAEPGEPWRQYQLRMNRVILDLQRGDKRQGEHVNGDTLDNQDDNLRIASNSQNAMNRKPIMANNTSGYKGVYFRKTSIANPWGAFVKVNGKMIHLGFRSTRAEAIELRREGERKHYGEFARGVESLPSLLG
jgi:hypothetical protein